MLVQANPSTGVITMKRTGDCYMTAQEEAEFTSQGCGQPSETTEGKGGFFPRAFRKSMTP